MSASWGQMPFLPQKEGLLEGSNEGWADSVKERSETKSSQSHRLTDHPILEAFVRPPLHWDGEDAVPGGFGGTPRDGKPVADSKIFHSCLSNRSAAGLTTEG